MPRKKVELKQLVTLPLEEVLPPERGLPPLQEEVVEAVLRQITETGQAPPVLVRDHGRQGKRLVTGAATLEALEQLGWSEVDCILVGPEADRELKVVEKLQRGEGDPWEVADALAALKRRYGWTQVQLGQAIGRTRDFVANVLAITQIAPEVRRAIRRHPRADRLTARHLRYVARTPRSEQLRVAQRILEQGLSTKELEREKRQNALRALEPNVIRIRALRTRSSGLAPKTPKEWRRYHRQLMTDLRRIDRREQA
jgi:ParB family chromosome partitioning protein